MRCFRMRGKKGEKHSNPADPPRRRANKQKGHGTYANDRPPIVGSVGRESGQVRLRMVKHTDAKTLERHIAQFTQPAALVNTDEWQGYNHIARAHVSVHHGTHEWARDEDGDGCAKSTATPPRGCGPACVIFYAPFAACTKTISQSTLPCANSVLTKSVSLQRSLPR